MNVFFDINDSAVNLSKVKAIGIENEKALKISFDDGTSEIYDVYDSADKAAERFGKFIVQIFPCTAPYYNVYKNNDGSYHYERVYFLAMCADGIIRSFAEPYRFIDLADEAKNFIGYYIESDLGKYPKSTDKD